MPPNRVRASNAQGRQKSCSECAKSKRRCDQQQPHCLRCTRQRLTCTYPSQTQVPSNAPTSSGPDSREASLIEELFNPSLELPFDLEIPDVATAPSLEFLDPTLDPMGHMSNSQHDNNMLRDVAGREVSEVPSRIERYPSAKSISNLLASELFESRVGYSMEQWKLAPRMMVEKNCTPWSHPNLYEELMPRSMQGAIPCFTNCSLGPTTDRDRCFRRLFIVHLPHRDQRKIRPASHH
jgi:hypothetical protein